MQKYDVIVIGCGGMGSAILYALADRGASVLGIDQHQPPHNRGSSHGQSRIIRQAYFEHPNYVPLLLEAYRGWADLEEQTGQSLLHQIGLLQVGPPDGFLIRGVLASAETHSLPIEKFSGREIERRFPGFQAEDDVVGLFEQRAGYLLVEEAIRAYLLEAERAGGVFRVFPEPCRWRVEDTGVRVDVDGQVFFADQLVVAAGSWTDRLINRLGVTLQVVRKHMYWFDNQSTKYRDGSPVFFFETPQGYFYGFPQLDQRGVKVADHRGGEPVDDPDFLEIGADQEDQRRAKAFLRKHLPDVSGRVMDHQVCMYTRSPDEHFIVDRHPDHREVAFVAGLSGHGFKFAPVLGNALADMILEGESKLPIGFFSLRRFTEPKTN